jgi:NIMA (never in mitosis gene a)-related kinase
MEFADNGDLQSKIDSHKQRGEFVPECEIWSIFRQMVQGLRALHRHKIVHRDIKNANVFLSKDGTVKMGDLNVSKVAKFGLMKT